jgi:hypothetical protein
MYDYETTGDLNEAIYYERLDADIEMAQYEAEGRAASARRKRGICDHGSRLGGGVSFYSADDIAAMLEKGTFKNRGGFTGAQTDITAGYDLCTDCGTLVEEF